MLNNWQRIEKVIKWTGMPSISAFAREIGLNRSENLYQIKRGNNGISKDLAESIAAKYPTVSRAWLITGEGEMIPNNSEEQRYELPFFKSDAADIIIQKEAVKAECKISFPMFKGCEFAAFTLSDAMTPEIPRGSILFFQKESVETIVPGATYLVVSTALTAVRRIRKEPNSSTIRLVSNNGDKYDDMVIDLSEIESLYKVRGVLNNL